MDRFQYLRVSVACVLVTLPLEFAFDAGCGGDRAARARRAAGVRRVRRVGHVGDDDGTWDFSERYTIGLGLPGGMAVEELLFFPVVPVCALLTLESVRNILTAGAVAAEATLMPPIYPRSRWSPAVAVVVLERWCSARDLPRSAPTGSRW